MRHYNGGPTHLLWSCVWSIAPMVVKRTSHSGAGGSQSPGRNILVVGQQRHGKRVVESWLSRMVVVESGE